MRKLINKILGRDSKTGRHTTPDVRDVLRRVDGQIGRAVTRLGDR